MSCVAVAPTPRPVRTETVTGMVATLNRGAAPIVGPDTASVPAWTYPLAAGRACEASTLLIKAGVPVLSPIAHSHPIAYMGGLDAVDPERANRGHRGFGRD
jgi:hypothetical protein